MLKNIKEYKDSNDKSFINEMKNLGFDQIEVNNLRYWTGGSNIYTVSTYFTKQKSSSIIWKIKTKERLTEIGTYMQFEINGNLSHSILNQNYSIVTERPSFWRRIKGFKKEIDRYYNISGDINLDKTEIGLLLMDLNEIYLEISCNSGQIDFTIMVENNPSKYIHSIIDFISNITKN